MAVAGKVTRAWRQPNAWFMASVTGGLTVPGRDQFRNPALVSSMEQPLPFNLLTYLLTYLLAKRCRCAARSWMLAGDVVDGQVAKTSSTDTSTSLTNLQATNSVSPSHLQLSESAEPTATILPTTSELRRQRHAAPVSGSVTEPRRRALCPLESTRMTRRPSASQMHPYRTFMTGQVPTTRRTS